MKATHTPGPWLVTRHTPKRHTGLPDSFSITSNSEPNGIAGMYGTPETAEANARLIAAAPELLEAAANALNVLAGIATGDLKTVKADSPAIARLRLAISRATMP